MEDFLLDLAAEDIELFAPEQDRWLAGERLTTTLKKLVQFERTLDKFRRKRLDVMVLRSLLLDKAFSKAYLKEEEKLKALALTMEEYFKQFHPKTRTEWAIEPDEEHQALRLRFDSQYDAAHSSIILDENFVTTPEFRELQSLSPALLGLGGPEYKIREKAEEKSFSNPGKLVHHILDLGKKGLAIQRYKGLGEMNPEQLWKTTMDPETRTFLQVTVEDSVKADEIFTILMGDAVEPRRAFIQRHALEVRNLDV
jgi:DNA gyrase subunit B